MPVNLQEKTIPSSATLFSLALLTLWSTQPTRAQDNNNNNINCISLASSKACPAFEQYYVGFPGLANRYSYLANVTDLDSFDQSLLAQVHSTDEYLLPLGCSSKDNDNVPYARYSLSRLCAGLIQDADDSLPCNFQHNLTPPPLCKTTCDDRVSSIEMITSNEDACSVDTTRRNNTIADLKNQCTSWQGYNGTDSQNCIAGQVNEPNNCGFQDDMESACQFCSSSTDSCCQNFSCKNGLSAGAIAGIVVGSVIGIALIALASFCLCSRRKRVRNDHFKFTTYVAPRDDYHRDSTRTSTIPLNNEPPLSTTSYTSHDHLNDIPTPPTPTAVVPGATTTTAVGTTFESLSSSSPPIPATHLPSVVPPPPESSSRQVLNNVEGESSLQQPRPEDLYMVVHPYPPQMGDELGLHVGDIIYVALNFDDGWGLGINAMTGLKGAFPMRYEY
ncbi:hypothetical protein BDC45DRAFT_99501 [Circinella umbellata]|nr:hypothetical protein BDC45DRAFT_99501 [Circinella umbellata]